MPVLMCRPTFFDVSYDINPWMSDQIGKVNYSIAERQWEKLFEEISKTTPVYLIKSEPNVPDLVFTANAGIIINDTVILSRFKFPQRQQEEIYFRFWFEKKSYNVIQPLYDFEGEGDMLKDSLGRFWMGTGFRSDPEAADELKKILNLEIRELELVDPRWYHLDTCFCPLPNGELLWYPLAFSSRSQQLILNSFEKRIEVDDTDALAFACNAVCIGSKIFLPKSPSTESKLNKLGYNVKSFDLSEFQKSGGSAKCLTLFVK